MAGEVNDGADQDYQIAHKLKSLISSDDRDYLVTNKGDKVLISELSGKVVALYFSASWSVPCQQFIPKLVQTYNELCLLAMDFEIVFVPVDEDEDSFGRYFSKMPWLAIPFSDYNTCEKLSDLFQVTELPCLVIFDGNGQVINTRGDSIVRDYGSEGYPFTHEKIQWIKEKEEAAKLQQTLESLLVSTSRDFLITRDGDKVPVAEIVGKIVGIYFCTSSFSSCCEFTQMMLDMYTKLKEDGESFEVVLVPLDENESCFKQAFVDMPWVAIPFKDYSCDKLRRYFEVDSVPKLVIIGSDGKTLHSNAEELVEEHGANAFPFSPDKVAELEEEEKAKAEVQSLESLLISEERDFVMGKNNRKVPVSQLIGKNILLYFAARWCIPSQVFMPKLIKAYHRIKAFNRDFEVIFVSSDQDESSFTELFRRMPWLAIPYGDKRGKSLHKTFKVHGLPTLVALSSTGKTITKEAREILMVHGAAAYPFTEERIRELEVEIEEMARSWPAKLKHDLDTEHELVKTQHNRCYLCYECEDIGDGWSYFCSVCGYDLHPKCALDCEKGIRSSVSARYCNLRIESFLEEEDDI